MTLAALLAVSPSMSPAEESDEVKNSKKKYRAIQMQIKDQEEKLRRARETEKSTLGAIDEANRKLNAARRELTECRVKLRATEEEMGRVSSEISSLRSRLDSRRQWMARKLRAMQRNRAQGDALLMLAASEDAADLIKRWRYLEELARYERGIIEDYKRGIADLAVKEAQLEGLKSRLASEEAAVKRAEEALSRDREEKQRILASVKQKRASYEGMLRELNEASRELQKLIEEEGEEDRFASKGFQGLKGRLPWPVNGKVALPYGTQKDPTFQTPVFRSGIYIAAPAGDSARAVFDGKVVFADWFKGYGQLVIINHGGGYHSLYANLSEIFLKEGDIISKRADVGKVGESSVTDQPSLYFEIRYKGKPLNPEHWLEKK